MKNKKGILGFAILPILIIFTLIFGIIAIIALTATGHAELEERETNKLILDSTLTTRVVVNYEVRPGYKVYDLIVDKIGEDDIDGLMPELAVVLEKFNINNDRDWYVVINDNEYAVRFTVRGQDKAVVEKGGFSRFHTIPPGVTLPNPDGDAITVLIERRDRLSAIFTTSTIERLVN